MRIRTRLTLWYSAILLGILLVIGSLSYSVLRWSLMQDLDSSLMTVAQVVHDTRSDDADDSDLETILRNLLGPESYERFVQLFDPDGRPRPRAPAASRLRAAVLGPGSGQCAPRHQDLRDDHARPRSRCGS